MIPRRVCVWLLSAIVVVGSMADDDASIVREEEVFSFLTMSTNRAGEKTVSSVVAFGYSYPLLLLREGLFAKAGHLNLTEDDLLIDYLKSHGSYLQDVRNALDMHEGTIAIKSNCTYDHGKIGCILMHTNQDNEVILKASHYFDDPPEPGKTQSFYRQVMSTPDGDKIREMFFEMYKKWQMFEKIHEVAARWKEMHINFMETCVVEEIRMEMTIAISPEPKASCKVRSGVPVLFVASIHTTDNEHSAADVSNLKSNAYGVDVSIPVTPRDGLIATCVVQSQMGWTKTEAVRLTIRGSDYILEAVPVPWDLMFPKGDGPRVRRSRPTVLSYLLNLHPEVKILLLFVIAALIVALRSRLRERRLADRLNRPPTPPPRRTRHNKKNV